MQMEAFFKNNFPNNLLSDRCAAFLLSQTQLGREAAGRQFSSTPWYDRVSRNCFDHSPYDETETTYQTKSLLSAVARRPGNAGSQADQNHIHSYPRPAFLSCTQRIRPGLNAGGGPAIPSAIQIWRWKQKRKKSISNIFCSCFMWIKKWDPTITGTPHHRNGVFFCVKGSSLCSQPQFGLIRSSSLCANWASEKHPWVTCLHMRTLDSAVF